MDWLAALTAALQAWKTTAELASKRAALKAEDEKISSVSLVPPLLTTADPDIDVAHDAVASAIDRSENPPAPKAGKKKRGGGGPVTGGSKGSLSTGYVANDTDDVAAAC